MISLLSLLKDNTLTSVSRGGGYRLAAGNRLEAARLVAGGFIKVLRYKRKGFYKLTKLGIETLRLDKLL